ncbi:MAG: fatty acid desaturase [Anaerolineaceae bacterium]|nr:fatty acid desaturase [Anaerolineaceae bacterium]
MEKTQEQYPDMKILKPYLAPYTRASTKKAIFQIVNSVIPYLALWGLMIWSLQYSYWITSGLVIIAALFLVRIFILFHDCGHNSLFPSKKTNQIVGFFLGVLVFTPSEQWWRSHAIHHASSGNLDKRGVGDVMTLTVDEYLSKSRIEKLGYRLFRHPLVMFLLGPIYMFLISHRIPHPKLGKKETQFQIYHNLVLLAVILFMGLVLGWKEYLIIQLPVIWLAGLMGIWLFFLQHQFEGVYWASSPDWNYVASALKGASYYELPKWMQWFSGNIGFHHIHHLSPKVPNYYLETCYENGEVFKNNVKKISFWEGFNSIGLDLIDIQNNRLIRFKDLKKPSIAN